MPDVIADLGDFAAPPVGSPTLTASDILKSAENQLATGVRAEWDKLATGLDSSTTSIVDTYAAGGIQPGAKLSIDLEDIHVWTHTTNTSEVERGQFGSSAAAHAAGAIIHVNREFTPFEIFTEINNELRGLSAPSNGLYAVQTLEVAWDPVALGYDLTGTGAVLQVLNVQAQVIGPSKNWEQVRDWRFEQNQDTTVFPSGNVVFTRGGYPGRSLLVTYATPFGVLSSLADDVETTTGLPWTAHDILALGAVLRCAAPTEIDRNQTAAQGSGRRAGEVPAGARANAWRGIAQLRAQRIREEAARLDSNWPTRLARYA